MRSALIGAWRLERCEATSSDGETILPLGRSPTGFLLYDASGTMSVAIMREDRAPFAAADILGGTVLERASAAATYMSYAGRWELEGARVRHFIEVSLFPNWVGAVQERRVILDGAVLVLATDPITLGGVTRSASMRWRRA